jgi:hypothetical protein
LELLLGLLERELLFVSALLPEVLLVALSRLQVEPEPVSLLLPVPPVPEFCSLQPTSIAAVANTMNNFFIFVLSPK